MSSVDFVKGLYRDAVDCKDVESLSDFLSDDVRFRIGNHEPVYGKDAVLEANRAFFASITGMTHQIDTIWQQGNDVICNGSVDYVRLDGSGHSAVFATVLKVTNKKVVDYLVYADLSQL